MPANNLRNLLKGTLTGHLGIPEAQLAATVFPGSGHKPKRWITPAGKESGSVRYCLQSIRTILSNPIYVGKIKHREKIYDGEHQPILDLALWQAAQEVMSSNSVARRSRHTRGEESGLKPDSITTNLGLGLFITKEIVVAHEGRIQVASNEKEGTTFSVRLPKLSLPQNAPLNKFASAELVY